MYLNIIQVFLLGHLMNIHVLFTLQRVIFRRVFPVLPENGTIIRIYCESPAFYLSLEPTHNPIGPKLGNFLRRTCIQI